MAENGVPATPEETIRRVYEDAERETAAAMESLVGRQSFGALLAKVAENLIAVTKITADAGDLVLRNLRVAGRADVNRLARQLNRTEDKLEQVLQEVESLHEDLRRAERDRGAVTNGAGQPA
jgi:methyl-accepting chemotaxis protein